MSITLFDTQVTMPVHLTDIKRINLLDESRYIPSGSTALLDAVGKTLGELKASVKEDETAVVLVITDGEENASREFNKAKVRELVDEAKNKGWQFVFIGCNPEGWADALSMGFDVKTVGGYAQTAAGTRSAFMNASANFSSMRASGMSVGTASYDWTTDDNGVTKSIDPQTLTNPPPPTSGSGWTN